MARPVEGPKVEAKGTTAKKPVGESIGFGAKFKSIANSASQRLFGTKPFKTEQQLQAPKIQRTGSSNSFESLSATIRSKMARRESLRNMESTAPKDGAAPKKLTRSKSMSDLKKEAPKVNGKEMAKLERSKSELSREKGKDAVLTPNTKKGEKLEKSLTPTKIKMTTKQKLKWTALAVVLVVAFTTIGMIIGSVIAQNEMEKAANEESEGDGSTDPLAGQPADGFHPLPADLNNQ